MRRSTIVPRRPQRPTTLALVNALILSLVFAQSTIALIFGGEGNEPIRDPGWPTGAAEIFNVASRVAHWEGPPFGGGQWHAECRGDTDALNDVLKKFAKIGVRNKRIVAHDGVGRSFWLNANNLPRKADAAKVDWIFMVWQPQNWERLNKLPVSLRPRDDGDDKEGPPAQIDIYTGGNIKWDDVIVPAGIEVIDQQLEAHGFKVDDGTVLEGTVIELADNKPLASRIELQLIEPQPKGGYKYTPKTQVDADEKGHWVQKKAPAGWYRIVASADGYVPRVLGHAQFDGQPRWQSYDAGLSRAAVVAGRVIDDDGKPLADVEVSLRDVACHDKAYESPDDYTAKSDANGQFRFEQVPIGSARPFPYKAAYCRPGLGETFDTPNEELELKMTLAAQLRVTVDFGNNLGRGGYMVDLEPEGGSTVGSWGGSAQIDETNEYTFENVPPGRYVLVGHPNPSNDEMRTEEKVVDLKGGETTDLILKAK